MGLCNSTRKFVVNEDVLGQGAESMKIFRLLGLSNADVDKLYTSFRKIDVDGSGAILLNELLFYLQEEKTPLTNLLFSVFDNDGSGALDFMEFTCCIWALLSVPEKDVGGFAFVFCDPQNTGLATYQAIKKMLESIHQVEKTNSGISKILQELKEDKQFSGDITPNDFYKWVSAKPKAIAPLWRLQHNVSIKVLGVSEWVKLTRKRQAHPKPEVRKVTYIVELRNLLETTKATYARKRELALLRLKKEKEGDKVENKLHTQLLEKMQLVEKEPTSTSASKSRRVTGSEKSGSISPKFGGSTKERGKSSKKKTHVSG